jgi:hypothetical protein
MNVVVRAIAPNPRWTECTESGRCLSARHAETTYSWILQVPKPDGNNPLVGRTVRKREVWSPSTPVQRRGWADWLAPLRCCWIHRAPHVNALSDGCRSASPSTRAQGQAHAQHFDLFFHTPLRSESFGLQRAGGLCPQQLGQRRATTTSNDAGCVMAGLYLGARVDIAARGKVNCGVIRCVPAPGASSLPVCVAPRGRCATGAAVYGSQR